MAYIRAFGGLGFDYAIMALKIGLFGQLSLDARMDFLWRHDASDMGVRPRVSGSGEVGVEFLVKLLFFTYERVLWGTSFDLGETESGNWANVQKYWEEVGKGKSGNEYPLLTTPAKPEWQPRPEWRNR